MKPDTQPPASTAPNGKTDDTVPNPDMQREDAGTADSGNSGTEAAKAAKQTSKTGEEKSGKEE